MQALLTHVAKTAFRFLPLESKRKQVPGEKDLSAERDCSWDHCNHIGYGTESVGSGQDVTAAHPLIHRPSNLNEAVWARGNMSKHNIFATFHEEQRFFSW